MKKVLFLLLPEKPWYKFNEPEDPVYKGTFGTFSPSLPLGVASISAYLKANVKSIDISAIDFTVQVQDAMLSGNVPDYTELITSNLSDYLTDPPDIIGISAMYNKIFTNVVYTSRLIKEMFPSSLLVVGGVLVSTMYRELLVEAPMIDALCYGEGEQPFLDLVEAKNTCDYITSSKTWITAEKITKNPNELPLSQCIENIDSLPFPDYDLFNLDLYQRFSRDHSRKINKYSASMIFSRGCPFDCNFCVGNMLHGRKVRFYSEEKAKEYVNHMLDKYHLTGILIEDNNFLFNKGWAMSILSYLASRNVEVEFSNGLYINSLDEEVILCLKNVGINLFTFPVESGSERVLRKLMNKKTNLDHAKRMIRYVHEQGLPVRANFMFGYPGETVGDIDKTIAFIEEIGVFDWIIFLFAIPFHGSQLYELCKAQDFLVTDEIDKYGDYPIIRTPDFTPEDVKFLCYRLNLQFNFVQNYRMKTGDYEGALTRFLSIEEKVKGHAFALFFSSMCCKELGRNIQADELFARYKESIKENKEWKMWSDFFGLERTFNHV